MERASNEQLEAIKGHIKQNFSWDGKSLEEIKNAAEQIPKGTILPGASIEKVQIGDLNGEWVWGERVSREKRHVILYFHGGGLILGSCDTHRGLVADISKASGVPVLVVEYRLAPEFKYPAANDDCLFAYRWLLNNGLVPENIVLGGDSVGGGLVLMTLLTLRDAGEPLPKAAFLLSSWLDLVHYDGESYMTRADLDPLVSKSSNAMCLDCYLTSGETIPAILSPIQQNLQGLPSLFIQVGDHEVLLSDSARLAERAREAGADVKLEVWENMWHVFQNVPTILEAQAAIKGIGQFVKERFNMVVKDQAC
ncbi:MAG TPA: alpha/beta hydrolase [Bacillota bacterium]|nr:alpha/beta hydrolase [Bacillota bacterium]